MTMKEDEVDGKSEMKNVSKLFLFYCIEESTGFHANSTCHVINIWMGIQKSKIKF